MNLKNVNFLLFSIYKLTLCQNTTNSTIVTSPSFSNFVIPSENEQQSKIDSILIFLLIISKIKIYIIYNKNFLY